MRDPIEVAYLAGYFDGEGCIGAYAKQYRPALYVVSTDREPLDRFSAMFGGKVQHDRWLSARVSTKGRTKRPVWRWVIDTPRSLLALEAMLPYLSVKRDQARLALQFKYRSPGSTPRREGSRGAMPLTDEERADRKRIADGLKALKQAGITKESENL